MEETQRCALGGVQGRHSRWRCVGGDVRLHLGVFQMIHKHAVEIIAWAGGEQIQLYHHGRGEWIDTLDPSWLECTKYRVKPEPKPDVVVQYGANRRGLFVEPWGGANLRLTFDGETGELKSAEVLK